MRSKTLIFFLILILSVLTMCCGGCGLISDAGRVMYERSNLVEEGKTIENSKGLFAVKVPDNYLYIQQNSYILELIGQDILGLKYVVFTQPVSQLPSVIVNDLPATRRWLVEEYIKSRAKDVPEVLMEEPRKFQALEALYFESFFPAKTKESFMGITEVLRGSIAYVNIIFYYNNHLYWIYHSNIIDFWEKVEPQVTEETRNNFNKFLKGFSLGNMNKETSFFLQSI